MTKLVAFCGVVGAGKDTGFQALWEAEDLSMVPHQVSFARSLKALCAEVFWEVPRNTWYGPRAAKDLKRAELHGWSARDWLERIGAGARAVWGADFWIRQALDKAWVRAEPYLNVITDCRYSNEVQAVLDRGGLVIFLDRYLDREPTCATDVAVHDSFRTFTAKGLPNIVVLHNATLTHDEYCARVVETVQTWLNQ